MTAAYWLIGRHISQLEQEEPKRGGVPQRRIDERLAGPPPRPSIRIDAVHDPG